MPFFRKRPFVIEAERFLPESHPLPFSGRGDPVSFDGVFWSINTPEGEMPVTPGDWIIRGFKGGFYAYKPDIFEETYEQVEGND